MSETPAGVSRPAPLLGQHNEEVAREMAKVRKHPQATPTAPGRLPLAGIRVLDCSWVWAGPVATMRLADLGAEVIKIEGHKRMDLLRRTINWPLYEPAPRVCPINQGMSYNSVNQNKKSLTLDLTRPQGLALALDLVKKSDMVIDNMRPGAMDKLGLGYDALKSVKPDIIVAASSSHGYGGPLTHYLGFATVHHAMGGGTYISGHADDHPTHGSTGDVDVLNANTTAFALLAALVHREKTGQGQFIDFSQCEGVSSIIGETLLGYEMTGQIPERMGNAHPLFAPHNVYRCWGVDRWLALEIHSDEEFNVLAKIMNRPELSEDPRFCTMTSRKGHEPALDNIIEEWTRQRDRDWMANILMEAGLCVSPCRDAADLYADRHVRERGSLSILLHPELGEIKLMGPPWQISGFTRPCKHSPLLGEHNGYVLGDLLGLTDEDITNLRKEEIIL
jgi:crotonobetainyl-CoA:carnitine CoA-transferase CaiB-like acyl-CoA transferase